MMFPWTRRRLRREHDGAWDAALREALVLAAEHTRANVAAERARCESEFGLAVGPIRLPAGTVRITYQYDVRRR